MSSFIYPKTRWFISLNSLKIFYYKSLFLKEHNTIDLTNFCKKKKSLTLNYYYFISYYIKII